MTVCASDCGAMFGAGSVAGRYADTQYAHQAASAGTIGLTGRWYPRWAIVLGVGPDASKEDIKRAYRALAALNHPDHGGSEGAMKSINQAYDEALMSLQ